MKKNLLISVLVTFIITGLCAYAADYTRYSSKFIKNFRDCDSYQETTTSNFEGQNFSTTRKINGWRNGYCKYQETYSSGAEKYQLDCKFADMQVEELYDAMKSRSKKIERASVDVFSKVTDPKTGQVKYVKSDSTIVKGSKGYVAWTKYLNNPYFCEMKKL
ncbi:hypothetical protein IJ579_09105 [bacterium]|nr:hypothetical protein [bacterium]